MLAVDLDSAIHILDNGVGVPLQLGERGAAEAGSAPRSHRDDIHVALPCLINRMRHPVGQRTVSGKPIVRSTFRAAADRRDGRVSESLADNREVILTDLGVRIHEANVPVTLRQLELAGAPSYAVGLAD